MIEFDFYIYIYIYATMEHGSMAALLALLAKHFLQGFSMCYAEWKWTYSFPVSKTLDSVVLRGTA